MRSLRGVVIACVAAGLVLTACGGGGTSSGGDKAAPATASARGVSASSITIAYIAPDFSKLKSLPIILPTDDVHATTTALQDVLNRGGPINGRTVEVKLYQWDPLKLPDSMNALCLQIAQDDAVFAAFALSYFGDAVTCLTGTNGVPLYALGTQPKSLVDTSKGNLFVHGFVQDDVLPSAVRIFKAKGSLTGKTIGYVGTDEAGQDAIQSTFTKAVESAGLTVKSAVRVQNPLVGTNPTVAAAAKNLRDAGVDAVFLGGNSVLAFSIMAEAQLIGWHPQWMLTDLSEQSSQIVATNAPATELDTIVALSADRQEFPLAGMKSSAQDEECRSIRNAVPGAPALTAAGSTVSNGFMDLCAMAMTLRRALEGAGKAPTRASLVTSFGSLGKVNLGSGASGSLAPNKIATNDQVRYVKYVMSCPDVKNGCFVPDGDWLRVR